MVGSPPGAGKTEAVCRHIAEALGISKLKNGQLQEYAPGLRSHLYVAPTLRLIHEVDDRLRKLGIKAHLITYEQHDRVRPALVRFIEDHGMTGVVALITHESYLSLPYFHRAQDWEIYVDEVPKFDDHFAPLLPRNQHLLSDHLRIVQTVNEQLGLVQPIKPQALRRLLFDKPRDSAEEIVRPIWEAALSKNHDLFVRLSDWSRVIEHAEVSKDENCNRVQFMSVLNPRPFRGTTILAANVEDSLLYKRFERQGVKFVDRSDLLDRLRYREFDPKVSERVRLHFYSDRSFSKTLRDKQTEADGRRMIDRFEDDFIKHFGERRFALVVNRDREKETRLRTLPGCDLMPAISHGLNSYSHHDMIVFAAALHRRPEQNQMLRHLGFSPSDIQRATVHSVLHQAVMRTNLRDPNATGPVDVVVMDCFASDSQVELFPGAQVTKFGDFEFKRKVALSKTQMNKRAEFFRKKNGIFATGVHQDLQNRRGLECGSEGSLDRLIPANRDIPPRVPLRENIPDSWNPSDLTQSKPPTSSKIVVVQTPTKHAKMAEDYVVREMSIREFVEELRFTSSRVLLDKEENYLFALTEFDPTIDPEGYRRHANVKNVFALTLDFDNGQLSPETFEDIFWAKAGAAEKRSFVIYSTFSRSDDAPNRFRVIMFFKRPATSIDEYQAVHDSVVKRLELAGFPPEISGLDRACRSPVQLFYMACKNRDHQELAFYHTYGLSRARDIERYGIDPTSYLMTKEEKSEPARLGYLNDNDCVETFDVEALKASVRESVRTKFGRMREGRHLPSLSAANSLAHAHFTEAEIETELAQLFGNEPHMRARRRAVMVQIKKDRLA